MRFPPLTEKKVIVFDLETQKSFDEVGGYANTSMLKVSVNGVWDYRERTLRAWREKDLINWESHLKECELLIGFNSRKFDCAVLQPYFPYFDLDKIPHLDLLESVYTILGFRLKLQSLVTATLGEGKSGSGLDALEFFRAGQWEKLEKYCLDDVRLTRDLFEYGVRHGRVWYPEGQKMREIKVDWRKWIPEYTAKETIPEQIMSAAASGKRLVIQYLQSGGVDYDGNTIVDRPEWTIDCLDIKNDAVHVFIHELHQERILSLSRIFNAVETGESSTQQRSLF